MAIKALPDPGQQQPIDELQLIEQVGRWADKNFREKRQAELGIIEEIGEATHCVLKRFQGIRGFDKEDFFLEKFTDALADTIIYLADWCFMHQAFFKLGRNQMVQEFNPTQERRVIQHLLLAASGLMGFEEVQMGDKIEIGRVGVYNLFAQRICNGVEYWAQIYEIDLRWAITTTWAKVGKRNWIANPDAPLEEQI